MAAYTIDFLKGLKICPLFFFNLKFLFYSLSLFFFVCFYLVFVCFSLGTFLNRLVQIFTYECLVLVFYTNYQTTLKTR